MTSKKLTLISLVLVFVVPFVAAYYLVQAHHYGIASLSYNVHGTLVAPGHQVPSSFHHPAYWTMIAIKPKNCDARCVLWSDELHQFPKVLSKYDLDVRIFSLNDFQNQTQFSDPALKWDWNSQGGILFVDPKGYIAIAYSYDANVKKSFFDVKKLLAATH